MVYFAKDAYFMRGEKCFYYITIDDDYKICTLIA